MIDAKETASTRGGWNPLSAAAWHRAGPRLAEVAIVAGVLLALVVYVAPTLNARLLEKHAFRQTQTAFTAREFNEGGIDLLHPRLPVFGEPYEAPFEFPLFQALAVVPMKFGIAEDSALRTTCLFCFVLTALLLFGLVRYVAGPVSGVAATVAFTFTPLAVVWSRTSMIEYLATAGGVGFAFALILWRDRRIRAFFALAIVAGLVGMLVKPTTAVFWIIPALAYRPRSSGTLSAGQRRRLDPATAIAVTLPLAAGLLWTRHADAIKAASPSTEWLTSSNLRRWNFGWVRQRLDPDAWWIILERALPNLVGLLGILLLPAIVAIVASRQRWFWLGVVAAAVLPLLVFMNLYVVHDYYLVAVSPAVAALIGLGAGWVWSVLRPRWVLILLPAAMLVLAWGTLELGRGYWLRIHGGYDDTEALAYAREVERYTQRLDPVAVIGLDWSPAVLYYAHRRGHMIVSQTGEAAYDMVHRDEYRHLFHRDPAHDDLGFFSRWAYVGVLGPHMYGIGDTGEAMPVSGFVAADPDGRLTRRLDAARPIPGAPRELRCDGTRTIPSGTLGTWIRFTGVPRGARLFVSGDLAPVPVRRAVFVSRAHARRGRLQMTCVGARALPISEVVDAPGV